MLNHVGVHPGRTVRRLDDKLRRTWGERLAKRRNPATRRPVTDGTLLPVNVAAFLDVLLGWREWRKLRWTVGAEFHVQENGGEPFLQPRWLRFSGDVDRSKCRGTEHRGEHGDDKESCKSLVPPIDHGTPIDLRRFRPEICVEAYSEVCT